MRRQLLSLRVGHVQPWIRCNASGCFSRRLKSGIMVEVLQNCGFALTAVCLLHLRGRMSHPRHTPVSNHLTCCQPNDAECRLIIIIQTAYFQAYSISCATTEMMQNRGRAINLWPPFGADWGSIFPFCGNDEWGFPCKSRSLRRLIFGVENASIFGRVGKPSFPVLSRPFGELA